MTPADLAAPVAGRAPRATSVTFVTETGANCCATRRPRRQRFDAIDRFLLGRMEQTSPLPSGRLGRVNFVQDGRMVRP
jgi:hypothetical protein